MMSKENGKHIETLRRMLAVDRRELKAWGDGTARTCGMTKGDVRKVKALYRGRIAAVVAAIAGLEQLGIPPGDRPLTTKN